MRLSTAETVDSAIPRHSAISVEVIRSRRSKLNDLDALDGRAVRDPVRCRRAVPQPLLALDPVAIDPLRARALADFGRLGGLRQRPPVLDDAANHPPTLIQAEGRVSVQLHPVSSLD
jgi:hypothetical protein